MTGYKKIIENMVEIAVDRFIESHAQIDGQSRRFAYIVEGSMELTLDKGLGHPVFTVEYTVSRSYGRFEIHGWIADYGDVGISSVSFDRMICQELDEDGWPITESAKPVHEFLYGKDLDEFKFDR